MVTAALERVSLSKLACHPASREAQIRNPSTRCLRQLEPNPGSRPTAARRLNRVVIRTFRALNGRYRPFERAELNRRTASGFNSAWRFDIKFLCVLRVLCV
jgi:hypothetical protein